MNSVILTTATRLLAPLLLVFSVYVLLRGHNEPGGGFIGGLIATTAFALVEKAEGVARARRLLRLPPLTVAAVGLGSALVAAVWGAIAKGYVLAGVWPLIEKTADGGKSGLPVGSVLLFDVGVYLVVVGAVCATAFALYAKATGVKATLAALRLQPPTIAVLGLGLALVAGLWGQFVDGYFLKGMWPFYGYGADGEKEGVPIGSVLMFDVGVYLVVVGSVLTILFTLEDDVAHPDHLDIEE
jgi:multisubunit Na+/H+ antiporter MnhB subunit